MKIPEHIIDEIRQKTDIVELIGESVRLKKSGRGYTGLCPFHSEKTPSFHVNQERGIFKCFGCGKGGNAFTFLMENFSLSFIEAVKNLAERTGVILEEEDSDTEKKDRYEAAYAVLKAAAQFYNSLLEKPEGELAKKYFRERDFSPQLSREFMLGYSPESWDATLKFLSSGKNFSTAALEDAGLVIRRDDGGYYDRFRGRVMFPIFDQIGRVVGFGARRMNEDKNQPKYINSPQSLVYDKSRIVYGIFQAKQQIREQNSAILVEGYADALTLHQAGFKNTIASSGTALTREQLQLVHRLGKTLYIVFDSDTAGVNAAMKGIDLALEEGFEVRVIDLPKGEDPDSFVRRHGAQAFELRIRDAVSFIEFQARTLESQGAFASPERQAEAIRTLVNSIAKIQDPLTRNLTLPVIAAKFRIKEDLLYDELQRAVLSNSPFAQKGTLMRRERHLPDEKPGVVRTADNTPEKAKPSGIEQAEPVEKVSVLPEEKELIRIALCHEDMFRKLCAEIDLRDLFTEGAKKMFALLKDAASKNLDPLAHPELQPAEAEFFSTLIFRRPMPSDKWRNFEVEIPAENLGRIIEDSLRGLRLAHIQREIDVIRSELREPVSEIDENRLQRYWTLVKEMQALRRLYDPSFMFESPQGP